MLSLAAIVFVTAELLPIGVLTEIGETYNESAGSIGLIVTGYAWVVAISAVFITSLLIGVERKRLLLILLLAFSISNLIVSQTSDLFVLYFGRIIGAFAHGVFWSIVGPMAVKIVPQGGKSRAMAIVFGGIAIASVIAVPLGTFISQKVGWQLAFLWLAISSLMIMLVIIYTMPTMQLEKNDKDTSLLGLLTRPYLRRLFPVTALAICGHFCAFTYIGPILEDAVYISHDHLPLFLLSFGIFGVIGNVSSGLIPDKKLVFFTLFSFVLMVISIVLLTYFSKNRVILSYLFFGLWGMGICLITVTLQSIVLNLAPDAGARASSIHVAMFNTGIGSGAFIGGVIINYWGAGITAIAGSVLFLVAFFILLPLLRIYSTSSITETSKF
ncbi:MFS transporter [Prodigiosinella aquatilis]|nr:MFS transporter [Prodigiosinella sp. LS101]WJV56169.1 MFS transporter [Prodigiosinella sp. LS101]WJV60536.1 MFS transporter [Pectobacteriaceae bacterium C111]